MIGSEAWAAIGASAGQSADVLATLVQWGLPPMSQTGGWTGVVGTAHDSISRRRVVVLQGITHPNHLNRLSVLPHGLRGPDSDSDGGLFASRRLATKPTDCASIVIDALSLNVSSSSNISALTSRGVDSRVLTVSLSRVDGSTISTWKVAPAGSASSGLRSSVLLTLPLSQASAPFLGASHDDTAFSVTLRCPDSGLSARRLAIGSLVPALRADASRLPVPSSVVWAGYVPLPAGIRPLYAYTIAVDCGGAVVNVTCAKDAAIDATPVTFVCPTAIVGPPDCGFWDAAAYSWSNKGCTVAAVSSTAITCACTHLTDFAARFTAVAEAQPLVFAAAACFNNPADIEDAKGLWGAIAAILAIFAILAVMGEVADDAASHQFERFIDSHPDLNVSPASSGVDDSPNRLLMTLTATLGDDTPVVTAPLGHSSVVKRHKDNVVSSAATTSLTERPLARDSCASRAALWAVHACVSIMTLDCCTMAAATTTQQHSGSATGSSGDTRHQHFCCCCCRPSSTGRVSRPRALACLPDRYTTALYRRYLALLVIGPDDDAAAIATEAAKLAESSRREAGVCATAREAGAAAGPSLLVSPRGLPGREAMAAEDLRAILASPASPWCRLFRLRGLICHVWLLRVLACHPILSVFTRFDPFRPRASRLAVALVAALASLFYTAFFFALYVEEWRGQQDSRAVHYAPASFPAAARAQPPPAARALVPCQRRQPMKSSL